MKGSRFSASAPFPPADSDHITTASFGVKVTRGKHFIACKIRSFLHVTRKEGAWWRGVALTTSRTALRSQKSSWLCCPPASISNWASSVGWVTPAKAEVHWNKNMESSPLLKKSDVYFSRLL